MRRLNVSRQLSNRPSQVSNIVPNSKLDDLLKKQYAKFKAFMRTTANIDTSSISDKWEFKEEISTGSIGQYETEDDRFCRQIGRRVVLLSVESLVGSLL